ncbi:MAG: hypothetical protein JJ992_27130, partial [Planctomycetes bacterium]|nr:hypothetical protein [Planctomycetota bacterium]
VRFHLLAFPDLDRDNVSVRVTGVRRQPSNEGAELLVSLLLSRDGDQDHKITIPVQFEIDGARSELTIEMVGPQYRLKDYRIALGSDQQRGWGRVSIPADANPADNDFYFVFDDSPPRKTVIVADDLPSVRPLELATSISSDPGCECAVDIVPPEQAATIDWEQVALLLWQAPLPQGEATTLIQNFIAKGGQACFFPPRVPNDHASFGVRWQTWLDPVGAAEVETWRGDQDLLAHAISGQALPVGDLQIRRYCQLSGEFTALATLQDGTPLIARVTTDRGGVYFWTTTAAPADSSLARDGVVLYVGLQRALSAGAAVLGNTRNVVAGRPPADISASWQRLAGAEQALSTDYAYQAGVYAVGDRLLAVNRDEAEDQAPVLADSRVAELFGGLDFARVDGRAGSVRSLVQEIWRLLLAAMIVAMVIEAVLCLPKPRRAEGGAA